MSQSNKATLYRMATKEHICPFGIKSKHLLKKRGFKVDDHLLTSREETNQFKEKHNVKTTPQTFIDGKRVGGYDDLVEYFDVTTLKQEGTTYQPIIALFGVTLLMALAFVWDFTMQLSTGLIIENFIAISMCALAILKLRDLYSFSNQFLGYDLLAQKYPTYAYIYPFAEAIAGVGMISGLLTPLFASISIFIGGVGAVSVFKAVYIDKRDLKCACVGGNSNVPLGMISLSENLMMLGMGLWLILR